MTAALIADPTAPPARVYEQAPPASRDAAQHRSLPDALAEIGFTRARDCLMALVDRGDRPFSHQILRDFARPADPDQHDDDGWLAVGPADAGVIADRYGRRVSLSVKLLPNSLAGLISAVLSTTTCCSPAVSWSGSG